LWKLEKQKKFYSFVAQGETMSTPFLSMSKQQRTGLILTISILFIDMLLYSLLIPIVPYITELFHPSSTLTGVLFGSYAIALLVATPFFGPLSDRISRKATLLFGLVGLAVSTILFASAHSMVVMIAARFVQGLAAAATWSAALALLADLFPAKMRGPIMGMALTAISTGSLLGAPLGGLIHQLGGYQMPFLLATGLTLLNIVGVFALLPKQAIQEQKKLKLSAFLRNRQVIAIACFVLLGEMSLCLLEPLLPVFLTDRLATTSMIIGLLFGAMTLAYGLVAPLAGTLVNRFSPYRLMALGAVCLALCMPLLGFVHTLWQAGIVMVLIGASAGFSLSPTLSTLGSVVERDGGGAYGAAYAIFNMFHGIGIVLGPLVGGVLTDLITTPGAFMTMSGCILVVCLLIFGLLRQRQGEGNPF
jgi:multidrug resistance protein